MTAVASAHAAAAAAEPKQESIVVTERKKLGNFWGGWGSGRDGDGLGVRASKRRAAPKLAVLTTIVAAPHSKSGTRTRSAVCMRDHFWVQGDQCRELQQDAIYISHNLAAGKPCGFPNL